MDEFHANLKSLQLYTKSNCVRIRKEWVKVTIKLNNTLSSQDGIRFLLKDEDYGFTVERFKMNNEFVKQYIQI